MIDKKEFQKMAKGILKSEKGLSNPKLMHPEREWTIGVIIGLIILITTAVWSALTYVSYRNGANIDSSTVESEVVIYRESLVESALETFDERQKSNEALISGEQRIIVPLEPALAPAPVSTSTEAVEGDLDITDSANDEGVVELGDVSTGDTETTEPVGIGGVTEDDTVEPAPDPQLSF